MLSVLSTYPGSKSWYGSITSSITSTAGCISWSMNQEDKLSKRGLPKQDYDAIVETRHEASGPCGPVNDLEEVVDDLNLKEQKMINEMDHSIYVELSSPGLPIYLKDSAYLDLEPSPRSKVPTTRCTADFSAPRRTASAALGGWHNINPSPIRP